MAEIVDYGTEATTEPEHQCRPGKAWERLAPGLRPGRDALLICDCGQVWRWWFCFDSPVGWIEAGPWHSWRARRAARRRLSS